MGKRRAYADVYRVTVEVCTLGFIYMCGKHREKAALISPFVNAWDKV